MNLLKKTLVAAGVATAVLATGAAQAAAVNNPTVGATGIPNLVASKNVANESVKTVLDLNTIVLTMGAAETLSVGDSVIFTLSNGTFAGMGTLTSTLGGVLSLIDVGIGSSKATYRVDVAATGPLAAISLAGATVTGTTIADNASVVTSVAMSGFVGGVATALFGSPHNNYDMQLVPAMTATVTTATGIFDVAAGFSALTTGTGTTTATGLSTTIATAAVTTTAGAGSTVGANTGLGGASPIPAAVPAAAATLITISGPMTGVSSIDDANVNGSSAAGVLTTGGGGEYTIDTATNMAWATQVATAGASVTTITFDGTVSYDASAYTATVSRLADGANYAANTNIGSGTMFAFSRNGSSFSTNSFGSLNKLTVTDRSGALGGAGADGAIAISAYDAAGAAVTCTGLTIANLPNNGTTTIQGADVTAACPGAKRIEGIVNSTSIMSTNTKVAADGATSQSGLGNGGNTVAN
jgi:hypothetical protein